MIGAIVVAISLFTLMSALSRTSDFVPENIQGNDMGMVFLNVEEVLNKVVLSSDGTGRGENIQHILSVLTEILADDNYKLDLFYSNPETLPLEIEITLSSADASLKKVRSFG